MAKRQPIRLGVIGIGRAGWGMFGNEIKNRKNQFEVVAGCDLIEERRQQFADTFGCKTVCRLPDLLADPAVELVYIATRSHDHCRHAAAALHAGKHVFLEKPMCVTHAEALKLQRLAAKVPGQLLIRHNRRYEPAFQHVREIIESGILGTVYEIKLHRMGYQRRADWQTLKQFGGGQLLNWGPHIIDHALQLLDAPVRTIWSHCRQVAAAGDCEDHVHIVLTGENQRTVSVEISGGAALTEPEYVVLGRTGALTGTSDTLTLRYLDPRKAVTRADRPQADPGTPQTGFGAAAPLPWIEKTLAVAPRKKVDMTTIWEHVFNAIRKGGPYPITLDQAVGVMHVISAVRRKGLHPVDEPDAGLTRPATRRR